VDVSIAVPKLVNALYKGTEIQANCIHMLRNNFCEDVRRPLLSAFIRELRNDKVSVRFLVCTVLKKAGAKDINDLKMLSEAAREAKKEKGNLGYFILLHSEWAKGLGADAKGIVADKKFHVPEVKKPDGAERVMRVRRLG
jgi:hypothetical protein